LLPGCVTGARVSRGVGVGGLERLVVGLAARSRACGVEPSLVAFAEDGPVRAWAEAAGIPVTPLGAVRGMTPRALRRLGRTLGTVSLAHAHDLGPWLNTVAARALSPRTRVLATFHQLAPPTGRKRGAARLGARASSALVACGPGARTALPAGVRAGTRVVPIGTGVTLPEPVSPARRARARARLGLPDAAVAVGYLGRMHPEKGPDLLVEAMVRHLRDVPEAHLVLVGKGPLDAALRAAAAPLGGRAHLLGEVVDDAAGLLAGLDVY